VTNYILFPAGIAFEALPLHSGTSLAQTLGFPRPALGRPHDFVDFA
jgi:hypothetical protein